MIEYVSIILVIILTSLLIVHFKREYTTLTQKLDKIPGPPKKPLFGNVIDIPSESDEILQTIQGKWVEQYGRIFRVWLGSVGLVDISLPAYIERLLSGHQFLDKGTTYDLLRPWLGDGLLLSSGEKWKRNRRLLTPAFHFQILDNFFDVFNKNAHILCQIMDEKLGKNGENHEVDVYPLIAHCALDIICETAMGIQVDAQLKHSSYVTSVNRISEIIAHRFMSLWLTSDWIFNLTANGREYHHCLQVMHDFTTKVIRNRKKEIDQEPEEALDQVDESTGLKKKRAFLDLLLIAARKGADMTEENIRNEVDTFMFEGHDTTASAMTWFLYNMATHPEEQEKVWNEINDYFHDADRPCTLEDAGHLKYLECCIKESLRLYPSVPNIKREITTDFEMGGYTVPAGVSVSLHIYALHRHPEYFPDPLSYKPERFLNEQNSGRHPYAFVPFSAGPRNCIGQRFALLEEKVVLTTLLRKFQFSFKEGREKVKECANLVLKPKYGMPLIITRRDK